MDWGTVSTRHIPGAEQCSSQECSSLLARPFSFNLFYKKNNCKPAKVVHSGGEPVTVGPNAKPFAKFA